MANLKTGNKTYIQSCPFCNLDTQRELLIQSELAFAIHDKFPVSKGHALIIPKRHVPNFFDLTIQEQTDCLLLLNKVKEELLIKFKPDGINVGINIGEAAGQTIDHAHIHLIPRYINDVEEPRGGVRGVIPEKRDY